MTDHQSHLSDGVWIHYSLFGPNYEATCALPQEKH